MMGWFHIYLNGSIPKYNLREKGKCVVVYTMLPFVERKSTTMYGKSYILIKHDTQESGKRERLWGA